MYRIKTDIRQFRCDSQEKVEKLIRNWVIRPTDLIYEKEEKTWSPIGDHPVFLPVFSQIRESTEDEPDTVVTHRPNPSKGEVSEATELSEASEDTSDDEAEGDAKPAPKLAGLLKRRAALKGLPRPVAPEVPESVEASEPLPIPEAPEGVELPPPDEEVTMMTERTADLLGVMEPLPIPEAPEGVEPPVQDAEKTQVFDREEDEEIVTREDLPEELFLTNEISSPYDREAARLDELGDRSSGSDIDDGWDDMVESLRDTNELDEAGREIVEPEEDLRATIELDASELEIGDSLDDLEDPPERVVSSEPSSKIIVDAEYAAQEHEDLPVPVAAKSKEEDPYADLPAPVKEVVEDDSYADLPAPVAPKEDEAQEDPYADLPAPVAAKEDAPEEDLFADLPVPVAEKPSEISEVSEPVRKHADDPDPVTEDEPTADFPVASLLEQDASSAAEEDSEVSLEEISSPAAPEVSEPEVSEPEEALGAESSDAEVDDFDADDFDEPVDDSFDELLGEPMPPHVPSPAHQDQEFVSEGYTLALPFKIEPSAEDLGRGLVKSARSRSEKETAFPSPQPKKRNEVSFIRYGYGDRRAAKQDHSRYIIALGVFLFLLAIITLVNALR